jgi:hypothetical protein
MSGQKWDGKVTCRRGHPLTIDNIYVQKNMHNPQGFAQSCRKCRALRERKIKAENKAIREATAKQYGG